MIDYSKIIEKETEKSFYEKLHEKILYFLSLNDESSFYEILEKCGGSDRRVLRLLDEMKRNNEISIEKGGIIKLVKPEKIDIKLSDAIKKYSEIFRKIEFTPTFLFDQRPITYESKLIRAIYPLERLDLKPHLKIAVLGDDDLVSVLLGLICPTCSVDVFEIDPRLIELLSNIKEEYKLTNLNLYEVDLFSKLDDSFYSKYDLFFTDPTPEPKFFEQFIKQAYFLSKDKGKGYLCFYPSHSPIIPDFQKILSKYNMVITDMLPQYTKYQFIEKTYRKSDLELLKKYQIDKQKIINFHENLTRVVVFKNKEDKQKTVVPNAVKRVITNLKKDPAYKDILSNKKLYFYYLKLRRELDSNSLEEIIINSVRVSGKIIARKSILEKILNDEFTFHYIPDIQIKKEGIPDVVIMEDKEANDYELDYPFAKLAPNVEHKSYISILEYFMERARQEKTTIYSINSSSAYKDDLGVLFFGGAINLGKSSSAIELSRNGFRLFSDERTLIDLKEKRLISGVNSVPLRKEIIKKKFKTNKKYYPIIREKNKFPKIKMIILPHLERISQKPFYYKMKQLDLAWLLNREFSVRTRGNTAFINNFSILLPPIETKEIGEKRWSLLLEFVKDVEGYYFQGSLEQLVNFVKDMLA